MNIIHMISEELGVREQQTEAAVKLLDEGNTVPFIARYRKEATGALDDGQLRLLSERLEYLRGLEERKQAVLASIEEQGKLTQELRAQIEAAQTLVAVEDLYLPYKQKRRTRASVARERGLEPLAAYILAQTAKEPLEETAKAYADPEKEVPDAAAAIQGAMDILAEEISDNAAYREYIRNATFGEGSIQSAAKKGKSGEKEKDEKQDGKTRTGEGGASGASKRSRDVYEMYHDYEEPVKKIPGHRVLALDRGEAEKALTVKITAPEERILRYLEKQVLRQDNPFTTPVLCAVVQDAYHRLITPAIERDVRNELTEKAQEGAIAVFGKNLKQLLMQPPVAGKTVLGWDPAFRTGCKLAVVDPTGKVLDTKVIYPTAPQNKVEEAKAELKKLITRYGVDLISVGNGTASRESEQVIASLLKELARPVSYVIVNEAGASVYSASKLASEEFPQFDVGQRSAASIARRLQDPLAELVKIDPRSIGVGQYQHDMNQKRLSEALSGVVEDCVNAVGVDLNTASVPLLTCISGINKTIAQNIVAYREANGSFRDRKSLLKVPKLGPKAYEQCAGFLRIPGGDNPLDNTSVHPESYAAAKALMQELSLTLEDICAAQKKGGKAAAGGDGRGGRNAETGTAGQKPAAGLKLPGNREALAGKLGIGVMTLEDIFAELTKPSRDPREQMPAPVLRGDIMEMSDLQPGMILKGTVRNVIDFGAFVDIGVHQDGLVHISQIADRYIKHPLEAVSVGDVVDVKVLSVDPEKKRIALTMKL